MTIPVSREPQAGHQPDAAPLDRAIATAVTSTRTAERLRGTAARFRL
jgi:hypothetical protein